MSNQRIIITPVYGGDHRDKASLNEKQGEALGVLPAGLPQGTEVIITIWLDRDGVFDLEAHLADGTRVPHRLLKGEADQKAVEALQQAEEQLMELAEGLSRHELQEFEGVRDRILDKWIGGDFAGALEDARRLIVRLDSLGRSR